MRWGLRARLTFWHGAAVALILAGATFAADRALSRAIGAQVDSALLALAETEAASALDDPSGRVLLHQVGPRAEGMSLVRLDKLAQIVDARGRVLDRSATLGGAALPASLSLLARLQDGEAVIETLPDFGGEPVRLVSLPIEVEGRFTYAIQVGAPLRQTYAFLRVARLLFVGTSAAILAAVVLTGGLLARRALRPIDRIVAMARSIDESNLAQRRFTADASHELRSPLSRLIGLLLTLARLDAGEGPGAPGAPVALAPIVEDARRRLEADASRRGVTLVFEPSPPVRVPVAAEALATIVANLVENGALGEKRCETCHSPEMGLLTSPAYASRTADPRREPHAVKSIGRYCATCHNGTTRRARLGALAGRRDAPVFTAARTGNPRDCERCHAPADHGADFTPAHGERAEGAAGRACLACHAQDWRPRDRQAQLDILAAEKALKANPDDPSAVRAVGPNNFCVYCHRTDREWLERD